MPGERLRTNPETFRYELIREIEQMAMDAGKKGSSTAKIERQLAKIGQRLYKELFSADLRREYRSFSRQITTLQIISDEPWIPWELIKPYDDEGGEVIDHDFLCMQFDLARWFTPAQAPAATIAVSSMACIAPSDSKLVEAQGERDDLQRLARETGMRDLTPLARPTKRWSRACWRAKRPSISGISPATAISQARRRANRPCCCTAAPRSPRTISWAAPRPG